MPAEKFLKITFHSGGSKKINAYLKWPSTTFAVLQREITMCLFEERKIPRCDLKTFWIDEDGDEIEIINQLDYDIFMSKRSERQHLQVAPLTTDGLADKPTPAPPQANDPSAFVIHDRVECDACGLSPIVGFRYKCIVCPNFDLCQLCEAAHMHSEHMMLRMPNDHCPTAVEAWVTSGGRCGRRGKRGKAAESCPYMGAAAQAGAGEPANGQPDDKEGHHHHHHHGRKHRHQRHSMRNGIFHHLYDMMQDLAEGGANAAGAAESGDVPKTADSAAKTAADAQNAANEAARAAQAAIKVAQETAQSIATACAQGGFNFPMPEPTTNAAKPANEPQQQQKKDQTVEGAATKTPPPTPAAGTAEPGARKEKEPTHGSGTGSPIAAPVLSASLENLAQFVDPQYMKAGIQILNNFSEMFAKMLDPMDDCSSLGTSHINTASGSKPPQQRQTSTDTSITSSVADTSTNVVEQPKEVAANIEQPCSVEANSVSLLESEAAVSNNSNISTNPFDLMNTSDRRRSQSEDSDWQLIDTHHGGTPNEASVSVNASTSTETIDGAAGVIGPAVLIPSTPATTKTTEKRIRYEQLGEDLRAHIQQQEQQQQQQPKPQQQQQQQGPSSSILTTSNAATTTTPPPNATEEKRATLVYHNDAVINSAVHAMMAMGFSNQGAYLTQLLESVNGNIAEALDIMTAAQRSTNN